MSISTQARKTAALLALAAASTPLAHAAPTNPNSLDGRALPCAPSCSPDLFDQAAPVPVAGAAGGFDWADAAAGFGLGVGTFLLAGGATLVLRQRRATTS